MGMTRREFLEDLGLGLGILATGGLAIKYGRSTMDKMTDSVFTTDAKFNDYKGKWEPYTVKLEDGKSPVWKVSRKCTKELGANSEHWREQIKEYNKDKEIDGKKIDLAKPLHVGDRFYVPADCKCQSYGKK